MKLLEFLPKRYDWGIRLLTLGKISGAYDRLTAHIKNGDRVLDIGCGTGALTLRAAARAARVKGIDVNPRMLDVARTRVEKANVSQNIEFHEMGVAELEIEKDECYDVVMSGLCFSELSEDEIQFALREIGRILIPGGLLLVADEVQPEKIFKKFAHQVIRFFLSIVVFLFAGSRTKALERFPDRVKDSGLGIVSRRLNRGENFLELVARKPVEQGR